MQRSNVMHTTLPPFATDLPDSAYSSPEIRSGRRPAEAAAGARPTSAYDHYEDMLENDEPAAGIGADFMNGGLPSDDDESDIESTPPVRGRQAILAEAISYRRPTASIPVASPRPGYASKPAVLDTLPSPSPRQRPPGLSEPNSQWTAGNMQMQAISQSARKNPSNFAGNRTQNTPYLTPAPTFAVTLLSPESGQASPVAIAPSLPVNAQSNPGSVMPFKPAFIKSRDSVRFNDESSGFIRGGAEGMVIPRRGAHGDNFWRRFSIIAQDKGKKDRSSWLKSTQSGTKSLSRTVWIVSIIILVCLGLGVGAGMYFGHSDSSHTLPQALGGTGEHGQNPSSSSAKGKSTSSSPHVSPTFTVARRGLSIPTNHARRRLQT